METKDRLKLLFASIDNKDVEAFLAFLSEDGVFRFGNADPVEGQAAIRDVLQGFFGSIKALHHDLRESWDTGDALVCHGMVTYTRHDESTLTVPFADVLRMEDDRIIEYLIFIDGSQLYKPV